MGLANHCVAHTVPPLTRIAGEESNANFDLLSGETAQTRSQLADLCASARSLCDASRRGDDVDQLHLCALLTL